MFATVAVEDGFAAAGSPGKHGGKVSSYEG